MPKRKYTVRLTEKEREELRSIVSKGKSASRTIKRAHVLLRLDSNADAKCSIDELDKVLGISRTTVNNILKDYQRRGIECIWRKKRDTPPVKGKITGDVEAHLIALACHAPPEGYCKWTLRLLSERMVQILHRKHKPHHGRKGSEGEQPETASGRGMVHPQGAKRGFCGLHGGCSGGLQPSV